MSSVAVTATGLAVSGGALQEGPLAAGADRLANAADQLQGTSEFTAQDRADRERVVSRSDLRKITDPVKADALSEGTGPGAAFAETLADDDPKDVARALLPEYGFSSSEFGCLDSLWTRESNWSVTADNPYSSAYGIPQALPGSKMASAGSDWATNPATQIRWGLGYIRDRYGTPCGAWGHSQSSGWY